MKFTFAPESKPLDGYTIKRAIHRGGFGEVYYALSDSGKEVALKLLQQNLEIELRGVRQCMNLKHPNLVSIFDIRTDKDGDHWIVMEYVHGKALDKVIDEADGPLPMEDVQRWLAGMAEGLNFLHDRGIVHRDLKPANVFMENGVVKIGDVGLAKFITQSRRSAQTESVGTVYYMAPEVARGRYGHEVDVYSLGVVLYEIITGRLPFDGESTAEILMKHLSDKPDLTPVPKRLRPVIAGALEKDPLRRTPSAMKLLDDFKKAVRGVEIPTTIPEESFTESPTSPVFADERTQGFGGPSSEPDKATGNLDRKAARKARIEARKAARHARCEEQRRKHHERRMERKEMRHRRKLERKGVRHSGRDVPVDVSVTVVPTSDRSARAGGSASAARVEKRDEKSEQIRQALKVGVIVLLVLAFFTPYGFAKLVQSSVKLLFLGGIGYLIYRLISSKNSNAVSARPEVKPARPPVAPVVVQKPEAARRRKNKSRVRAFELCPETPRSIPLRHRVTELAGSLTTAVVCTALITAVIVAFSELLVEPGRIALFGVTAVAASWIALTAAKLFEGTKVSPGNRRIANLIGGALVGCIAFFLQQMLFVSFHVNDFNVHPEGLVHSIGTVDLANGFQPTLAGYAVFFAGLFVLRRWWRHSDSMRRSRLSVWSVLLTTFVGLVWSLIITFPMAWGVTWAAAISCIVQLSAAEIVQRERTEETAAKPAKAEPEFIPGKEAPAWTKFQQPGTTDVITTASGDHDVITARGATIAEAERKLAAIARKRLIARITDKERRADDSSMIAHADDRSIASHAVEKRFEQPGTEKVRVSRPGSQDKEYSTKAYQVYWKLDFSEKARQEIRREAAVPRLWIVGGLVALLTMIAAAVATYLRVDARTEGKYRFRLKSATTVFLVAAGLLLTAVLPFG
eukprot:g26502.t1